MGKNIRAVLTNHSQERSQLYLLLFSKFKCNTNPDLHTICFIQSEVLLLSNLETSGDFETKNGLRKGR